ncbi:hypothetical protein GF1_26500 [Desulfolithobacter dissulfuricans]|uniref:FlgD Ig-like domain-containing protein n=1 Tax=Desulfolithobacter dissulfuricans TaxID=2795293 RepID=A0A915U2S1_9BACT|nr:hypothetical protein [Desulfolithobacter dissulfuricans]BCO10274.1 hypothetical protein GF1_26500 [Desulfolithobacter dissulfuricans]
MHNHRALILALLLWISWPLAAQGQTIALFPLLDLTIGANGVNLELTSQLRRQLEERNFELVDEDTIMRFLVRHRIRTLGRLTSYEISMVKKELDAEFTMVGTVCELKDKPGPAISLSLQLIRTTDRVIIWSNAWELYFADRITLLGLHDPRVLDDMYQDFFSRLLDSMPRETLPVAEAKKELNIDSVVLTPQYARPGEEISCKVKLYRQQLENPIQPDLVARIGNQEYPLSLDREGYYFIATWPAQEAAGRYTVTLHARWPDNSEQELVIGSYGVDTEPPEVTLNLVAREIDGELYFSDKLIIIPKLLNPEPVVRWEVMVLDDQDETIVLQSAAQHVPRRLTWRGKTSLGATAPDGDYRIVFKVWDRAGRESSAEAWVVYRHQPPDIVLEVTEETGQLLVDVDNLELTPISYWWMKFFAPDGHLLKLAEGEELPATVTLELTRKEERTGPIECILVAQDELGNKTWRRIRNLLQLRRMEEPEDEDIEVETEWVEEF